MPSFLKPHSTVLKFSCGLAVLWCAAIVACGDASRTETRSVDSATPAPAPPKTVGNSWVLTGNDVAGIVFSPTKIRIGERVGELTLESIEVRATPDLTRVGTARFRGEVVLSGATLRHPEADLRERDLCFEADSVSAARMPRWAGDERRAWFCFENQAEAQRLLGPPSEGTNATIIVDRFNIHRGLTDEVNSARLRRVAKPGLAHMAPPPLQALI